MQVSKSAFSLYNEFYAADIIVASPLGLRMVVTLTLTLTQTLSLNLTLNLTLTLTLTLT